MAVFNVLLLPGDGIGPEVMAEVSRVIDWVNDQGAVTIETETGLVGGCGLRRPWRGDLRCDHGTRA